MRKYITTAILAIVSMLCFWRNSVWLNDGTLWSDVAEKSPNKARGYNEIGLYDVDTHAYEQAFGPFMKSLQLDPYQPVVYINLGLAYEGLEQWDSALKMYERAISQRADDPVPYYNMGGIYYNQFNDRGKALGLFLKARDLNPLEPDVHEYLGKIYQETGKYDLAKEEFRLNRSLK